MPVSPTQKNSGFSLIELMVVMSISSLILISVSTLFITVLSTNGRTGLRRTLKAEGTQALNQMTFLLRNAKPIAYTDCLNLHNQIVFTLADNEETTLKLMGSDPNRIASASASDSVIYNLSPETVRIPDVDGDGNPDFSITCSQSPEPQSTEGQYISINFTLERLNNDGMPTGVTEEFMGGVQVRNARN